MPAKHGSLRFFPRGDVSAAALTGWTKTGTIVHLTTITDTVAIGAAAMVGTEKVRIVGGLRLDDTVAQQAYIEMDGGDNAAVSPAGAGRFRWNDAANRMEVSENGGGWVAILQLADGPTLEQLFI